jgi:peptidoglycan/LPS O-acetylase OafA/YrhL
VALIAVVAAFSVQNSEWFHEYAIAVFVSLLCILYTIDVLDPTEEKTRAQVVLVLVALASFFAGQLLQGWIETRIGRLSVLQILGIVGVGTRVAINYLVMMNEPLKRHRDTPQPLLFDGNTTSYAIYVGGIVAIALPEVVGSVGSLYGVDLGLVVGIVAATACAVATYLLLGSEGPELEQLS